MLANVLLRRIGQLVEEIFCFSEWVSFSERLRLEPGVKKSMRIVTEIKGSAFYE